MKIDDPTLLPILERIALALERLAPPVAPDFDPALAEAFVWHAASARLEPVLQVNRVEIGLLKGISQVMGILTDNTQRFAKGAAANNALLWGARGMGKSSLVKAAHAEAARATGGRLKLVEIHREEIESLPDLMRLLRAQSGFRFILFCDDLSFDNDDTSYKALKAALDGGIEGRPENVLFYATSNRRHLLPRDMTRMRRCRRRFRCQTVSAYGSASTIARKMSISRWWRPMPVTMASTSQSRLCAPVPWNGRSHAAAAPAAWPGSLFRI